MANSEGVGGNENRRVGAGAGSAATEPRPGYCRCGGEGAASPFPLFMRTNCRPWPARLLFAASIYVVDPRRPPVDRYPHGPRPLAGSVSEANRAAVPRSGRRRPPLALVRPHFGPGRDRRPAAIEKPCKTALFLLHLAVSRLLHELVHFSRPEGLPPFGPFSCPSMRGPLQAVRQPEKRPIEAQFPRLVKLDHSPQQTARRFNRARRMSRGNRGDRRDGFGLA